MHTANEYSQYVAATGNPWCEPGETLAVFTIPSASIDAFKAYAKANDIEFAEMRTPLPAGTFKVCGPTAAVNAIPTNYSLAADAQGVILSK